MRRFVLGALIVIFSIVVLFFGGVKKAEALSMKISGSNFTDVIIADGGFGDLDGLVNGTISGYYMSLGGWADMTMTAGVTKPQLGSAAFPQMHLTLMTTASKAGTVNIELSETGYTNTASGFVYDLGGSGFNATPSLGAWLDNSNTLFGHGTPLGSLSSFGSSGSSPITATTSSYSLSFAGGLTFGAGGGTASIDNSLATPEPGTIALLGIGLAGLVGVGARRRMKKNGN